MRARRRHFLVALVAAVVVGLVAPSAPAAVAYGCPASTSWDTILQRCV